MTRTLRVVSGVVLAVVMVVAVGSCSSSHDDVERAVVPTTPETTVPEATSVQVPDTTSPDPTPLSDEEAIIAAVHGYWRVILESSAPPNPYHPGLVEYIEGDARGRALEVIEDRTTSRQAVRLPDSSVYSHNPRLGSLSDTHATIEDCAVDDSILYNVDTNEIINDDIATELWEISLQKYGEVWKVTHLRITKSYSGVSTCG